MSLWRDILGLPEKNGKVSKRSYHAANTGRLFADFLASSRSPDSEIKSDLVTMRNRSRALARDDVYVKRYLTLLKTNVVGDKGMVLQVKARNTNNTMDTIGNQIIEDSWSQFGLKGNCTADGRLSWVDLQKYVIEATARDGEAFVQVVRNRAFIHGIAYHPIEADLIDEQKNERLKNGGEIRMGIEVDQYQRPVAYWVKKRHPGDYDFATVTINQSERIDAKNIIHVYDPIRAGQTRGEPWMHSAISQLKMLNAHREAELVASRMAASKMGFFTSDSGEDAPADDYENNVPIIDAEPGTFHQLPAGVDFKPFDPSHPATAFSDFQKGILRGIASGLNVSYASLSNDLEGTSYSSIRQGALEERDAYKMMQQFLLDHFVLQAYGVWLMHVMEFGYIPIPASRFPKFFTASHFRGRGWQWVDPQKEVNAAVEAMHNGIMSMQDVSTQYGRDIEETLSQWQRDKELADQFGLELAFFPFGGNKAAKGMDVEDSDSSDDQDEDDAPAPARSMAPTFIQAPPVEVQVKHTELAPAKRSIRLVRDEEGVLIGAEIAEDENGD
jgi:lambda family phage portal protein